ncbi:hypothetical protein ACQY0O_005601 [Thecaphora frezii]
MSTTAAGDSASPRKRVRVSKMEPPSQRSGNSPAHEAAQPVPPLETADPGGDEEEEDDADDAGAPDGTGSSDEDDEAPAPPGPAAADATRNEAGAATASADAQQKKVSCLVCRDAKVKCVPTTDGEPCVRCAKLGKECVFRTHKRGRKPGKIKSQQIQRRLEILDRTLAEIRELNQDVQDPDAESLVKTLTWQLHRSKFFSKGYKPQWTRQSPSPARSPSAHAEPHNTNHDEEAAEDASAAAAASAEPAPSSAAGVRALRLSVSGSRCHAPECHRSLSPHSLSRTALLGHARPSLDASATRSKSDFNMLIDLEDHASVSRVPDEIHTLSNPLKLLAQASDESRDRDRGDGAHPSISESGDERSRTADGIAERIEEAAHGSGRSGRRRGGTEASSTHDSDEKAQGWANTYFSRGAFHPVYDNRQEFDPIDQGILTAAQAERLVQSFYKNFGTFIHIFDPHLSTISYIRKHSAFLLTVLCATAAEFDQPDDDHGSSPELAGALRRHVEDMMPAIMCGDYKNVEMAQAFLVLASYQPMADSAMSDQTWAYLGNAIRIATELGCNLCCYSLSTPMVHKQEHYQRQLRNTERLWLNLWIFEKTLASQTGQRFHLSEDGVIAMCSSWHRQEYALPQDEALVAFVELRRIMACQSDHFNTHILRSLTARLGPMRSETDAGDVQLQPGGSGPGHVAATSPSTSSKTATPPSVGRFATGGGLSSGGALSATALSSEETQHLSLQLEFFRNSVHMDLKRWEERWLTGDPMRSELAATMPTPLQTVGALYLHYAALVTYSLPLPIRYTVDVSGEMEQLYRHCYSAATGYMSIFADRCQRRFMTHIPNSSVVSVVYCAVFALDICRRASRLAFVRPRSVEAQARKVSLLLHEIGSAAPNRNATLQSRTVASKYAEFLAAVLGRMRRDEGRRVGGLRAQAQLQQAQADAAIQAVGSTAAPLAASAASAAAAAGDTGAVQGGQAPTGTVMQPTAPTFGRATSASQRHSSNVHFHPNLFDNHVGAAPPPQPQPSMFGPPTMQLYGPAPPPLPAQAQAQGPAASTSDGTWTTATGQESNALDKHWSWMMVSCSQPTNLGLVSSLHCVRWRHATYD